MLIDNRRSINLAKAILDFQYPDMFFKTVRMIAGPDEALTIVVNKESAPEARNLLDLAAIMDLNRCTEAEDIIARLKRHLVRLAVRG